MIKKILGLVILLLSFVGISFGNFDGIQYYNTFDLGLEKDVGDSTENYFELLNYGNFLINGTYNYLNLNYTTNANRIFNVFWTSEGLYLLNSYYDNLTIPKVQGYFYNYCKFDINNISFNSHNFCYDTSDYSQYIIDDFFTNDDYKNPDKLYVHGGYGSELSLCFIYTNSNFGVCTYYFGLNSNSISQTLSGSLNLGYNPTTPEYYGQSSFGNYITSSLLGGGNGGDDGGGDDGGIGTGLVSTGINIIDVLSGSYTYSNCTYQALIDYMQSVGASKYLCYGGLDNFDLYNPNTTYNPVPGFGKTLAQILAYSNSWDTPLEWYNFWNGLRGGYSYIWSSYPAVYKTWFDLYYQYGGNSLEFDAVREYCAMISLDIDFQNTVYKGQYFKQTCKYIQDNNIGIFDGSGNVVVGVNWNGIGNYTGANLSGSSVDSPVGYIQNFFNELKSNFPTRYVLGGGALPVYIITFLCAIVLFRFLRH